MRTKIILIGLGILTLILGVYFIMQKYYKEENELQVIKETKPDKADDYDDRILTSKGYEITNVDDAYYVDGYLIVNKTYSIANTWLPSNPQNEITSATQICKDCLDKEAWEAWSRMKADATSLGLNIYIASAYRSYSYQSGLYNGYISKYGNKEADTFSARPGHSEHHTALAFDLNSVTTAFAATSEGKWVNNNAYLYGFIIRYPENKNHETGYMYEPWHLRFVGLKLAKDLYNNGDWLSMEYYFGITSEYS